jgi:hypothetical protein
MKGNLDSRRLISCSRYRHGAHDFLDTPQPTAVFCRWHSGGRDLALPRLTAKLHDEFEILSQSGRANRMAFVFKASGRVDRRSAAMPLLAGTHVGKVTGQTMDRTKSTCSTE